MSTVDKSEFAATFIELQQLLIDFGREIDLNEARNITDFFEEDGSWVLNGTAYRGHAGVRQFHDDRAKRLRGMYPDGVPLSRHTFTNQRLSMAGETATFEFMAFYYTGAGTAQVPDEIAKTMVVDNRMQCRRNAAGEWRISSVESKQILYRNEST